MNNITVDSEFQSLIPPLSEDEFARLEKSIIAEGVRDPIITWGGVIVDGHNRYTICEKHGIDCPSREREFESRDAAKIWIIENQFGRRNLSAYSRGLLALELEPLYAAEAERRLHLSEGRGKKGVQNSSQVFDTGKTREKVAKAAGVSHDTIRKIKAIEAEAAKGNPVAVEAKAELESGEKKSIHGAYVAVMGKPTPRKLKDTFTEDGRRLCVMCGEPIDEGTAHSCRPTVHKACEQEYQRDWCKGKRNKPEYADDGRRICVFCGEPVIEQYQDKQGWCYSCGLKHATDMQRNYRDADRSLRENVPTFSAKSLLAELHASAERLQSSWAQSFEINESMGVKLKASKKKRLEKIAADLIATIEKYQGEENGD